MQLNISDLCCVGISCSPSQSSLLCLLITDLIRKEKPLTLKPPLSPGYKEIVLHVVTVLSSSTCMAPANFRVVNLGWRYPTIPWENCPEPGPQSGVSHFGIHTQRSMSHDSCSAMPAGTTSLLQCPLKSTERFPSTSVDSESGQQGRSSW